MHHRKLLRLILAIFASIMALAALLIYHALPPSHLVLMAGAPTTTYADFAARYQEQLRRHRVTLEIRSTGGSLANLEAMRDPSKGADIALTVTGLTTEGDAKRLASLGGIARGALWIFYRADKPIDRIADLHGMRISTGAPGSAINAYVRAVLAQAGALKEPSMAVQLPELDAIAAITGGKIDVMFLAGLPDSQAIRRALSLSGVRLMNVSQAGAIALRDQTLSTVVLPRGYIDLSADLPPADVTMLSVSSSLIVRRDLHPALQYLMLEVAKNTHREPDVFQRYGEFPAPQPRDLPLSPYAERFYRDGRPFLFDYLPFWVAAFADRAVWIGVPMLAILLPAMQLAAPGFLWLTGRRLRKCIHELRMLEREIHLNRAVSRLADYERRLEAIDQSVRELSVPEGLMSKAFELRGTIDYVKRDLSRMANSSDGPRP